MKEIVMKMDLEDNGSEDARFHEDAVNINIQINAGQIFVYHTIEDGGEVAVSVELYEGKLVGRIWNEDDQTGDPTARVIMKDYYSKKRKEDETNG